MLKRQRQTNVTHNTLRVITSGNRKPVCDVAPPLTRCHRPQKTPQKWKQKLTTNPTHKLLHYRHKQQLITPSPPHKPTTTVYRNHREKESLKQKQTEAINLNR